MDRISELSYELLIKVLLFLPTKVAVSTSLLSKRWECLWMYLPKLEFSDRGCSESECKRLRCFLDRNLPLHRAPAIESLRFEFRKSRFRSEDIRLWVLIAVSGIIRELDISYYSFPPQPKILPSSLYACKSLVDLNLSGKILLDVPRFVCLASLKSLILYDVIYFNQESFPRLLSICPVLKQLRVVRCEGDKMGNFTVVSRSLLSLLIYIPLGCDLDGYVIDTPSLRRFKLMDLNRKSHYCMIENMPKLNMADIHVSFPDIKSLIGSITTVKHLTICSKAMYGDGFVFAQLKHLKLCICEEYSLNLLVRVLKDSPKLQVLELFITDNHEKYAHMVQWNQSDIVPKCLLSSLQTFIWSGYRGAPEQRDLVVYILKNACHLKTTTIFFMYLKFQSFR